MKIKEVERTHNKDILLAISFWNEHNILLQPEAITIYYTSTY